MIRDCRRRAKNKNRDFDLDITFAIELYEAQNKKCAVSGISFDFSDTNFRQRPFAPSIDRIDCSKGYTKDNIRFVCTIVNMALNQYGENIFAEMCSAYIKNKK